jgi:hypothetical protein
LLQRALARLVLEHLPGDKEVEVVVDETVVSLVFASHARSHKLRPLATAWYSKEDITFSDAMTAVRRMLWSQTVMAHLQKGSQCALLPGPIRKLVLDNLSMAA